MAVLIKSAKSKTTEKITILIVLAIFIFFISIFSGCESRQQKEVMGTFSEIKSNNQDNINLAYEEIDRINSIMSIYGKDTELSKLNREKQIDASEELSYIIDKSIYFSIITEGSFDVTIFPVLELYKKTFNESNRPPTDEELGKEMEKINHNNIIRQDNSITLINNASIDLGGIAKGYAIDKALEKLDTGIVNIGGDIAVKSTKHYTIALVNPDNKNEFITKFSIKEGCIATSGNYERYFDKSRKSHHILDPNTGKSAQGLISVTIIGDKKKALECDALATGVFVMGKEKGLKLINNLQDFETLIIDENNSIAKSENLYLFEIA